MQKSLRLVKERWRLPNHNSKLTYLFLIKLWNYVVELPVFSAIKPGVADLFYFVEVMN